MRSAPRTPPRIRKAILLDTGSMARLLNEIIARGGTTAMTDPVTAEDLRAMMDQSSAGSAWHVALDDAEAVTGFQWIERHDALPPEACDIATFVRVGQTGHGIGSALFTATAKAARAMGYRWINATIRADNEGGLTYYQSRGFRPYGVLEGVRLADGTAVDKIMKRFDL